MIFLVTSSKHTSGTVLPPTSKVQKRSALKNIKVAVQLQCKPNGAKDSIRVYERGGNTFTICINCINKGQKAFKV